MNEDITVDVGKYRLNCRAAGIIIHNNKVLFHKSKNEDYYALVGGRVKFGENSQDTVVREFKEELGKEIRTIGYVSTIENFFEFRDKSFHEIMFVHLVEFVNEEDKKIETTIKNIEKEEDDLNYEWIDFNDIETINIKPKVIKEILIKKQFPVHAINDDIQNEQFEFIYKDPEIKYIYQKIKDNEDDEEAYAHHDFEHVNNVMNMTEKILKSLNCNQTIINDAKIAAILHDTGVIKGKKIMHIEVVNLQRNI